MLNDKDGWRLQYHLMPPAGWLNDPNGLCQFQGTYHVYFQYSPAEKAPNGSSARTWGHYAGRDLLHLQFVGVPFWPEEPDRDGCYSGCALKEQDAVQLYYTGNIKLSGDYDYIHDGRESNTIRVTTRDGLIYGEKQVLLRTADYPEVCTRHVRDPKVWRVGNDYRMLLGARLQEEKGAVLLYESTDGIDWQLNKMISTEHAFGYMWECPDYIELPGCRLLSACPQGVSAEPYRYQNLYQSGYFVLDQELAEAIPSTEQFYEWDYGFDFYAPQTFVDEQGRTILIGWVGMPDRPYVNPTDVLGWENALTVPRVLTYEDGRVHQNPIEELEELREEEQVLYPHDVLTLKNGSGDIDIAFLEDADEEWSVEFGQGMTLRYADGLLQLRLSERYGRGRTERLLPIEQITNVRILVDTSLLEVYIDDGEFVMTTRFYPDYRVQNRELQVQFHCPMAYITAWQMRTMPTNEQLQ